MKKRQIAVTLAIGFLGLSLTQAQSRREAVAVLPQPLEGWFRLSSIHDAAQKKPKRDNSAPVRVAYRSGSYSLGSISDLAASSPAKRSSQASPPRQLTTKAERIGQVGGKLVGGLAGLYLGFKTGFSTGRFLTLSVARGVRSLGVGLVVGIPVGLALGTGVGYLLYRMGKASGGWLGRWVGSEVGKLVNEVRGV